VPTRRYHALLVAGLPPPFGRQLLLVDLVAEVTLPGGMRVPLCDPAGGLLCDFRLEGGLPIWRYVHEAFELEKRIVIPHAQNTVHVVYRLLGGRDLGTEQMPPLNQPILHTIGFHYRTGKHEVTAFDCDQFLSFADMHLGRR